MAAAAPAAGSTPAGPVPRPLPPKRTVHGTRRPPHAQPCASVDTTCSSGDSRGTSISGARYWSARAAADSAAVLARTRHSRAGCASEGNAWY